MKKSDIGKFLLGIGSSVIGFEIVLFWNLIYFFGGVGLLLIGIYLISISKKAWKDSVKNILPFRPGNLFRFPRLPYFQTSIMFLLLIATIFLILPFGYELFIIVLLGLAIPQTILIISEENIKDEFKILTIMQFQLFIFFSTFIYVNFDRFYLFSQGPEYISSLFLYVAWLFQFIYMYFKILK
ncbi:MAG: hypothetical protein V5A76_06975, partial [Candidatus Thermoplasmatota archaeon]